MEPDGKAKSLIAEVIEALGLRKNYKGQIVLHCYDGECKDVELKDKNKELAKVLNSIR